MVIGRYIYIIGGETINGVINEIWVYNFYSNSYILAQRNGEINLFIAYQNCWIKSTENYDEIFLIGGESFYQIPNNNIYQISIWSNNGEFFYEFLKLYYDYTTKIGKSHSSIITSELYFFQFFGYIYEFYSSPLMIFINMEDFNASYITLPFYSYSQAIIQYKKSFYIFGGGLSLDTTKQLELFSSDLYNLTIELNDNINFICSAGTIGKFCEPCPVGTYAFNSTYCKPCSMGTYSNVKAADSIFACRVCNYGTYSDILGAFQCKDCEANEICMIGKRISKHSRNLEENTMLQPTLYSPPSDNFSNNSMYILIGTFIVWVLMGFIFSKRYRTILKNIDLYTSQHSQKEHEPIMLKRTEIGGLFSAWFLAITLVLITGSILSYSSNNIVETKGLVPFVTVTDNVASEIFLFSAIFYGYGGTCATNLTCSEYIFISDSTLTYDSKSVFCEKSSDNCMITIKYINLQIGYNPSITITFEESNSYASYISINATSFSSIPGEISSILLYTYPDSLQEVFRGTIPTIFSLEITPSVRIN